MVGGVRLKIESVIPTVPVSTESVRRTKENVFKSLSSIIIIILDIKISSRDDNLALDDQRF